MLKRFTPLWVLLLAALFCNSAQAQLSGTFTIPGAQFPTLDSAITALNDQGVGTGGVVLNLTAAQTAPTGGYRMGSATLNNSTSATKTITINGNGNTLTAQVGTSTTVDGIFTIVGTDRVTINALNVQESAANTTNAQRMEWGYALLKRNATDGCNFVTIQNCSVTLNKANTITEGIKIDNHNANNTTLITVTNVNGVSSNNSFIGNTIQNVNTGIVINGFAAPSPYTLYGQNNQVIGNTIQNFGSTTTAYGIYLIYQNDALVYGNNLNNTAGGGTPASSTFYGIYHATSNDANSTIRKNQLRFENSGTSTMYTLYVAASGDSVKVDSNYLSVNRTATSGILYNIYVTGAARYCDINANVLDSTTISGTSTAYLIYPSASFQANGRLNINDNKIRNYTRTAASGGTYAIYQTGSVAGGSPINIIGNKISDVNYAANSTGLFYAIYAYGGAAPYPVRTFQNDTIQNVTLGTTSSSGTFYGIYSYNMSAGSDFSNNLISGVTNGGTHYAMYVSSTNTTGLSIHDNVLRDLENTATTPFMGGIYMLGGTDVSVYSNLITDLQSAITTSAAVYPLYFGGGTNMAVYNNMISDIRTPAGNTVSPVYGMYFNAGTDFEVYHNTINLNPVSSGATFGATGVYYASGIGTFDFRNNIVRVNATPVGTGFVAALRRSAGTAGVAPANLASTSNSNIYFAPATTNSFLYCEGLANPMVNAYNTNNDANFNTACGLYKAFMAPRESSTYRENNLAPAGGIAGVFAPTGASYAKSNAVPTTAPAVSTDFLNAPRPTPADAGALQFSGTAVADAAGPTIAYTPVPTLSYCATPPAISATITDLGSGVNTTTLTRPRMYFKKSTEANAFGGANNFTFNGWKWVEGVGNGPVFTFTPDYSRLTSTVVNGDSIQYFIIAQDNAVTPNVSSYSASYPTGFCPTSVALTAAAGPLTAANAPFGYRIGVLPSFTAVASRDTVCISAEVVLTTNIPANGLSVVWQQAPLNGSFTNIPNGNVPIDTLSALTATSRFRAVLYCGTTAVDTTEEDTTVVLTPQVLGTASNGRCGPGTVTLGATASPGATIQWYTAATGGAPFISGNSYTTPSLNNTTNYYVAARLGGGSGTVGPLTPADVSSTGLGSAAPQYVVFDVVQPTTIVSVDVFPTAALGSSNTIEIRNSANTLLNSIPYTVTATSTNGTAVQTIVIGVALPSGTDYRMKLANSSGGELWRHSAGAVYPYTSAAINITGNSFDPDYYYWFYNWKFSSGCETPRTQVTAFINTPVTAAVTVTGPTTFCPGDSVTLTANTGANLTYTWLRNGVPVPGATGNIFRAKQTGAYRAVVSSGLGCADTAAPVNVTVLPVPTTVTPASPVFLCTGGSVTLNAPTGSQLTYQWRLNGGNIPGATAQTYTVSSTGNYQVRVTNGANGCSDTSVTTVVGVGSTVPVSVTPSAPQTICPGTSALLSTPQVGNYTYQWRLNGGNIPGATSATYAATATGQYSVQVTAGPGCSNISAATSVTVAPLPPTAVTPTGATNLCAGTAVVLTGPTASGITYQWIRNGQIIPGATASTFAASQAGTYRLRTVATATGCADTSAATVLTARPLPTVTTTPTGAYILCSGDTLALSASSPTALSYQWRIGAADVPGATGSSFNATAAGQITVRVTDSNGCSATSAPVSLTLRPEPLSLVTYATPLQFCEGSAVVLTAYTTPGVQYQWYLNGQPLTGVGSAGISYTASQSGAYSVRVTDNVGCTKRSDPVTVTVFPTPVPGVTVFGSVLSTVQPYAAYQWYYNAAVIPGANAQSYNAPTTGIYRVDVTDANGCQGSSQPVLLSSLAVGGPAAKGLKVYPNPTTGLLRIEAPMPVTAYVRNALGQTVLIAVDATEIDLSRLADGTYLLVLTDADGRLLGQERITKAVR